MKPLNNYASARAAQDFEKIPVGGYIAVIKQAQIKQYKAKDGSTYEKFEVAIDIAEGDFKDYYASDFKANTNADKKWKGVVRMYNPKDDGSEEDERTMAIFKAAIEAIEESNPGYHWDWDEGKLKGKKIGLLLRNEEWDWNSMTGWTAKPFKLVAVEKIRSGKIKLPKDKPLKRGGDSQASGGTVNTKPADFEEIVDDDDLPF